MRECKGIVFKFFLTANFEPVDLQDIIAPHLRVPIHICLEPEAQGLGIIIRVIFMRSKYPHLLYKMQKSRFNLQGTVHSPII